MAREEKCSIFASGRSNHWMKGIIFVASLGVTVSFAVWSEYNERKYPF